MSQPNRNRRVVAPQSQNFMQEEHLDSIQNPIEKFYIAHQYDSQIGGTNHFFAYIIDRYNPQTIDADLNSFLEYASNNNIDLLQEEIMAIRIKLLETNNNSAISQNQKLLSFLERGLFENAFYIAGPIFHNINDAVMNENFVNHALEMAYLNGDLDIVTFLYAFFPIGVMAKLTEMRNVTTSNTVRDFITEALEILQQ